MSLTFAGLAAGRAFAVVGFFDFSCWLSHDLSLPILLSETYFTKWLSNIHAQPLWANPLVYPCYPAMGRAVDGGGCMDKRWHGGRRCQETFLSRLFAVVRIRLVCRGSCREAFRSIFVFHRFALLFHQFVPLVLLRFAEQMYQRRVRFFQER